MKDWTGQHIANIFDAARFVSVKATEPGFLDGIREKLHQVEDRAEDVTFTPEEAHFMYGAIMMGSPMAETMWRVYKDMYAMNQAMREQS